MNIVWHDVRFGVRTLARSWRSTGVAIVTLSLGLGGTAVIFSLLNAILVRPLPFYDPSQLVWVMATNTDKGWDRVPLSAPNAADLLRQSTVFEGLGMLRTRTMTLTSGSDPARVRSAQASPELLRLLRVNAPIGRTFTDEDAAALAPATALLSHRLWNAHFGADPEIVGQTVRIDDQVHTIVGVLPQNFHFPPGPVDLVPDIWVPLDLSSPVLADRGAAVLFAFGRLKRGIAISEAQSQLDTIAARLAAAYPETNQNSGVTLGPLTEFWMDSLRPRSGLVFAAAILLLLIAVTNTTSLLIARFRARQGEFAVRAALGASRGRLIQQIVLESLLVSVLAGTGSLPLAFVGARILGNRIPPMVSHVGEVEMDATVLGFTLCVTIVTGITVGMIPAMEASKTPQHWSRTRRGSVTQGGGRALRGIVIANIAISMIGLTGAVLALSSLATVLNEDLGYKVDRTIALKLTLPVSKYTSPSQRTTFFEELLERSKTIPGVASAALANHLPLSGNSDIRSLFLADFQRAGDQMKTSVDFRLVSQEYFQTMQVHLLRGGGFRTGKSNLALINKPMVERFFPAENPIGQTMTIGGGNTSGPRQARLFEIAGVVVGEKYWRLDLKPTPQVYARYEQETPQTMALIIRALKDPIEIIPLIRSEVKELDPDLPVYDIRAMEARVEDSLAPRRFITTLLSVFALIGLVLTAVGVYAIISYDVSRRTSEIGVRVALGASSADILKLVHIRCLKVVAMGILVGIAGSIMMAKVLSSFTYGLSAYDPRIFGLVSALVLIVAGIACHQPARRAMRIEPATTLRAE